jgi:tetratricopeptide (TPR) repeat protein
MSNRSLRQAANDFLSLRAIFWFSALFLASVIVDASLAQNAALQAAQQAYDASDYEKAVSILGPAAQKNPDDGDIQLWLAKSHFELKQYDEAIAAAEKAIAASPNNSKYHEWLGRSFGEKASKASWLSALNIAKKAQEQFELAVKMDDRNFSAYQALIEFDCAAPGIAGGGEDKAEPYIKKLSAVDAGEGHYATGNCRRQKKDFAAAELEFDKALETSKAPDLIFDIGDYALHHNQADRLIAVADAGQKAAPRDPRAKFYRAAGYVLKKEKLDEADSALHEYLKTAPVRTGFPRAVVVHEWLGRMYEAENKSAEARKEYEVSAKLDPKYKPTQEALKHLGKS